MKEEPSIHEMFEMLISPRKAENHPWSMFFIGFVYVSLSLLIVNLVFARDAILSKHIPVLVITFTVIFSMPFIHSLIRMQAIRELVAGEKTLFKPHIKAINSLLLLFLGFLAAFTLWYSVMPGDFVMRNYGSQIEQFCRINFNNLQDCIKEYELSTITGNAVSSSPLMQIIINNLYVLLFTLVFSLAFGAGAIFILAWNASVIGTAIGMMVKGSLINVPMSLLAFLTHGIPEIVSYLIAALAGGILSTAIVRKDYTGGKLKNIISDFTIFMTIAFAVLIIAGIIEVYVTPLLLG